MKNPRVLLTALMTFALAGTGWAASSPEVINSTTGETLVVSKLVHPTMLPESFTGGVVEVGFTVDESGVPQDVQVLSSTDREVKKRLTNAVKRWRFDPAASRAVEAKRYIVPIEIVMES